MKDVEPTREREGRLEVEVVDDVASLAAHAADRLESMLALCTIDRPAVLAVSGGRSPRALFRELASRTEVRWDRVHLAQVDERMAPEGAEARNWTVASEAFAAVIPAENLHPMPVESNDPVAGAAAYEALIGELTAGRGPDIVHLGLGSDGHTASLFPGDGVTKVVDRGVAVTEREHAGWKRMTMTFPMIASAHRVIWQVQGAEKAEMLARLVRGDRSIPAGRVPREGAIVCTDGAAARLIQ
jgi:6-phosphogluconolactonase